VEAAVLLQQVVRVLALTAVLVVAVQPLVVAGQREVLVTRLSQPHHKVIMAVLVLLHPILVQVEAAVLVLQGLMALAQMVETAVVG
jgi:hypothetical protein